MRAVFCLLMTCSGLCATAMAVDAIGPQERIRAAFDFLAKEHDRGQADFVIFDDRDSGYEHFSPSVWMGDMARAGRDAARLLQTNWTGSVHSGLTSVRWFLPRGFGVERWGGIFWEFPEGKERGPGHDLSPYVSPEEPAELRFWARRMKGPSEMTVAFRWVDQVGGLRVWDAAMQFGTEWKEYSMRLPRDVKLDNVTGAFAISAPSEYGDVELLLDDARVCFGPQGKATRLAQPRFVRSYVPANAGKPDTHFRNACYAYDNALIALAFCARGKDADLEHARLICDAFVTVQEHDPAADGRLRSAYLCGELLDPANGKKPRIPGYWDDKIGMWMEDRYAVSSDCGNMAWVAIALLECWKKLGQQPDSAHLKAARRLCGWIHDHAYSGEGLGGYTGGMDNQSAPDANVPTKERRIPWKSCEHNIDVFVAFSRLAAATGDAEWEQRAEHAKAFVLKLLELQVAEGHHNLPTGTQVDGRTINTTAQPIDVNPWALLAFRDAKLFGPGVEEAARLCAVQQQGGEGGILHGFDFNEDKDGVWWEGTGQMCLAFRCLGQKERADEVLEWMRRHGTSVSVPGAILAASKDSLTTGFIRESGDPWVYWHRAQTGGATCWYLFAELGWNPYWGEPVR